MTIPSGSCSPGDRDPLGISAHSCVGKLSAETSQEGTIYGKFLLGISTDERGRLLDLCLISSELGDTPDTLDCVVKATRKQDPVLEPNLRAHPWKITWYLEE